MEQILEVTNLSKSFAVKGFLGKNKGSVSAVDKVSFSLGKRVVEKGPKEQIFSNPCHPYTQALLHSVPSMEAEVSSLDNTHILFGEMPSPLNPPSGCRFRTRCQFAEERCAGAVPPLVEVSPGHEVACILHESVKH